MLRIVVGRLSLPDDLVDESVLTENLIEHHFDIVAGVPIAVIVERPCWLQHTGELLTTRAHELDISLRGCVPVIKRPHLSLLVPEDFVIAIRVERWVNINQIDAGIREFRQLVEVIPAVNDLRVDERRRASTFGIAVACHLPERENCNRNGPSFKVDRSYLRKSHERLVEVVANLWRKVYDAEMDESRKRVIDIMAAVLAARKLAQ